MRFELNRSSGFDMPELAHPWAFGSGELKQKIFELSKDSNQNGPPSSMISLRHACEEETMRVWMGGLVFTIH